MTGDYPIHPQGNFVSSDGGQFLRADGTWQTIPNLHLTTGPATVAFHDNGNVVFTIKHDGTIEFGPGFTTNDEASKLFWQNIQVNNPNRPKDFMPDTRGYLETLTAGNEW